jgi:hypothetical protein
MRIKKVGSGENDSLDDSMLSGDQAMSIKLTSQQMMEMKQHKGGGSNLDGTLNKSHKSRITKKDKDGGSEYDSDDHSSDYEDDSEMQSDVSGETHSYKQSSDSSDTVYSSDDGESGLDLN